MLDSDPNPDKWKLRYEREKKARKQAEKLLEEKSSELYIANQKLAKEVEDEAFKYKREEEKFTALFHHCYDGIILQDHRGTIIDANKAICDILGVARDDLVGVHISKVPTRDSIPVCIQALREIIEHGSARFECHLLNRSKTRIPVDIAATKLRVGQQTIIQGIIRDVSEQQKAANDLEIATNTAIKANEAKSMFLAMMSHEIRTPLNGVIGFTDLLLESELSNEQKEHLTLIKKSGDILLSIINDILDFSRIESGQMVLENVDFNLTETIGDVLDIHSQLASSKQVGLTYSIDLDVPNCLHGDAGRIKQILLNLISNALKFTECGAVSLEVKKRNDNFLQFTVSDSGIGIDSAIKDQLFEPFLQADVSTTRKYGGTGLGLAICRQLSEAMGGTISVDSEVGQGSQFTVTLPLQKGEGSNEYEEDINKNPVNPRDVFALIVEDNHINAKLAKLLIERMGVVTHIANNGEEALKALSQNTCYNAIFMDMQMPVMDGIETARRIRTEEEFEVYQGIPIIAMTANALPEDEAKCIAAGMNGYITKPISHSAVKQALQNHKVLKN